MVAFAASVTVSVRSQALYARNVMSGNHARGFTDSLVPLTSLELIGPDVPQAVDGRSHGFTPVERWQ
jgi:hypothetical protein